MIRNTPAQMSQRWKSFLDIMQMDVPTLATSTRKFVGVILNPTRNFLKILQSLLSRSLRIVLVPIMSCRKLLTRNPERNLTLEYVDFLKNQLQLMTQERDLYRKAYLTLENLESPNPPDFSSLNLVAGFEPWSVKKRKIEAMRRKAAKEKLNDSDSSDS